MHGLWKRVLAGLSEHVNSDPAEQHQHDYHDQNYADYAHASMAIAIAIAAEAATKSAEEKDHENDKKDKSKRHNCFLKSTLHRYFPLNKAPPYSLLA